MRGVRKSFADMPNTLRAHAAAGMATEITLTPKDAGILANIFDAQSEIEKIKVEPAPQIEIARFNAPRFWGVWVVSFVSGAAFWHTVGAWF